MNALKNISTLKTMLYLKKLVASSLNDFNMNRIKQSNS